MRRALRIFGVIVGLLALVIAGFGTWVVIARQDLLQLVTAGTAKTVCSDLFLAKRDADEIVRTDLLGLGYRIFHLVKVDVNVADQRVDAALLGFIAPRHAQYTEGRGCTNVMDDAAWKRPAAQQLPPAASADVLWPEGEKVQLSANARLQKAVNDPALQGPGMRAIVVVHDGRIIAETYGQGFGPATPLHGWSMTKSVTAALVGMAIGDGKLSLDQKHLFPQWAGDGRAEISIADLMSMTGGLKWSEQEGRITDPARLEYLVRNTAAFARDLPLDTPPGTRFNYSGAQTVLLTRLWQDAVGEAALSYPRERLFTPLGMTSAVLETDEVGTFLGEGYLFATARDWARYGEFLRLGGAWNGQQLLPAGFVDYVRSPSLASDQGHGPVYGRGQIWLAKGLGDGLPADTFMMEGHLRQVVAIIPSRKLVIVRMGMTREDIGFSYWGLLRAIVAAGP